VSEVRQTGSAHSSHGDSGGERPPNSVSVSRTCAEERSGLQSVLTVKLSYRLRGPILALKPDRDHPNLQTLPAGTLVVLEHEEWDSAMVEVRSGDETYTVFIWI
jgi:hypothetical protein